jgi:hypothetical protein
MRPLVFSFMLAFAACNTSPKTDNKPSVQSETGSKNVRNDIAIKTKGLEVEQAFLLFDGGKLVPQDNKVEVGQRVDLRMLIKGWKAVNGKVFLGASEKITTDEGQTVLDEQDLFASFTDGVSEADAGVITISATISRIDKLFKYFEVSCRVWDKQSDDNATAVYRLYLK